VGVGWFDEGGGERGKRKGRGGGGGVVERVVERE